MQQLMQQAQKMQKQITENQKKMENTEFSGDAGGGKIIITMKGNYKVVSVKIDPTLIDKDDPEMLEDLLTVAFNNCKSKVDDANKDSLGGIAGNMNINSLF